MKISKILVPTDFSEEANNALEVAVGIARVSGAEIILLHVIDIPDDGRDVSSGIGSIGASDQKDEHSLHSMYIHRLLEITKSDIEEIKNRYGDVRIREHMEFDSKARNLTEFILPADADLIVMGSRGASGIEEIIIGSNTEKVIRMAKSPVLTVKSPPKQVNFKNIVFASNFHDVSQKAIDNLKAVQELFGATIHMVKIITTASAFADEDEPTRAHIRSFAKTYGFEHFTANVFHHLNVDEGIREFARNLGADLICMTTHGRSGFAHFLLGSVAEDVANHAVRPVLTFNEHYA